MKVRDFYKTAEDKFFTRSQSLIESDLSRSCGHDSILSSLVTGFLLKFVVDHHRSWRPVREIDERDDVNSSTPPMGDNMGPLFVKQN